MELEPVLETLLEEIKTLLLEKNKNYGNSFFITLETYGWVALLVRLTDKFFRLKNHLTSASLNEKILEDTLKDIAGYCLLSLAYLSSTRLPEN